MKLFDKIFNRRAQISQRPEPDLIPAASLGDRQVVSEVMAQNNDQLDILVKNQADFLSNGTPKKSIEEVIADKAILEIQNIMGADFDAKQLWQESGRNLLDEAIKTGSTDLIQQLLPHYSQLLLEPISTYEIREISVKDDLVFIKPISPLEQALRTQPAAMVKEFLELL